MGFLDKLNKTVGTLREQVERTGVIDKVKQATPGGGSAAAAGTEVSSGDPQSVAEGADLTDKQWWPTAADVSAIAGVTVGTPEDVETPETFGSRFVGTDARGTVTFEIHCVREEPMLAAGSAPAWIDPRAATHERHRPIENLGDYAVAAGDGDSRFVCYCGVGDVLFYVEARSPGVDESKAVERIMRKLLDWPE